MFYEELLKLYADETFLGYGRVSTDEQIKGYSLDYQEKVIKNYCKKLGGKLHKMFIESHSAKKPGRPKFNEMLAYARKHKIKNIVFAVSHRASRNPLDSGMLSYMAEYEGFNIHLIENNRILNKDSKPQDYLIFEIENGFNNMYSRNLRVEVTTKMREKADQGYYPTRPMVGYMTQKEKKAGRGKRALLVPDPEKAPFIRRIFELYSTGQYSYASLAAQMRIEGFYISPAVKCGKSNIEDILNNPIYMGDFIWAGKRYYNGKHEPLISRELYYLCQRIIKQKTSTKCNRKNFLFSHIIKCSVCGCTHVGEIKKGKYIYYHCTGNKGGNCKSKYLKESYIEELFLNTLDKLTLSDELMPVVINQIKTQVKYERLYNENSTNEVNKKIQNLKNRLNKMFDLYIDGELDKEMYKSKRLEFERDIEELEARLKILNENPGRVLDFSIKLLELFRNARGLYSAASFEKKKELINLVCSNFYYDGEKLTIAIKKAFQPIVKIASFRNGGLKAAQLELFVKEYLTELRSPDNVLLLRQLEVYSLAA
jgi:DNA invertase Pin-like site-specific DNA recombinase